MSCIAISAAENASPRRIRARHGIPEIPTAIETAKTSSPIAKATPAIL
jgi:hypothetical protein